MTTQMKHTPTPWYVYEDDNLKICGQNEINEVIGATWPYKTAAIFDHQGRVYNEHDSAYIVHCVNTHEALKASLLKVRNWAKMNGYPEDHPLLEYTSNAESLT